MGDQSVRNEEESLNEHYAWTLNVGCNNARLQAIVQKQEVKQRKRHAVTEYSTDPDQRPGKQ